MDALNILQLIGQTIRELRLERGMTQQQVADLCGFQRTFLSAVEKGQYNVSMLTLLKISVALGVLPAELLRRVTKAAMKTFAASE
jgi:transcriptional regulator with XRE-family HTH domain